jgi:hypothetical protein
LFAAGCGNHDVPHSKTTESVSPHAPETTAAKAPEPPAKLQVQPTFELIDRLDKAPALTPEQVMEAMHIELRHDPEKSGPAFKAYTQPASATSPYKSVELRMPNGVGSSDQLLTVDLSGDSGVSRKDIIARYGQEFDSEVPSPQAKNLPAYLRYKRSGGYVSLGVTGNDPRLVSFVISKSEK